MKKKKQAPVHPGEILRKEFLEPMGLSQSKLAIALHVPVRRINEIVLGKRGVTADTALRLANILECLSGSGLACKWAMNSIWLKTISTPKSTRKRNLCPRQ